MSYFNGSATTNFSANSPSGNFSPIIFSQKVLNFFRTASVVEGITNSDYFGELASYGDSVKIILEPVISVTSYTRGQEVASEALADNETTIQIDKANKFQFQIDDIEGKLAHVNWEQMATSGATYALKNTYDKEVLTFMSQGAQVANIVGGAASHLAAADDGAVITLGHGSSDTDPLNLLSLLSLKLDEAEVPEEGRYAVVSPRFMELLARTDSKLLSTDYNQGEGGLKNGLVMNGKLRGFSLYKTNNAPRFTLMDVAGSSVTAQDQTNVVKYTGGTIDDGGVIGDIVMAGHMSAVATVSCIDKMEKIRSEKTFADIVRGLHVYGRAVIKDESLAVAYCIYAV